jgi:hypothetical protein
MPEKAVGPFLYLSLLSYKPFSTAQNSVGTVYILILFFLNLDSCQFCESHLGYRLFIKMNAIITYDL